MVQNTLKLLLIFSFVFLIAKSQSSVTILSSTREYCISTSTVTGITFSGIGIFATESIASWSWNFDFGASILSASGAGPHVVTFTGAGTRRVTLSITGTNGSVLSTERSITASANSQAGNISANKTSICKGETANLITNGQIGTVQWWSSTNASLWNLLEGQNASVLGQSLNNSTFFQTQITNGSCPSVFSTALGINVDAPATGGTIFASSNLICRGKSVNISSCCITSGQLQDWQKSPNGTFAWVDLNTNSGGLSPDVFEPIAYFRIKVQNGVCPVAFSNSAAVSTTICGISSRWSTTSLTSEMCIFDASTTGVNFLDQSVATGNTITGWLWSFGAGASTTTFSGQNPPTIYFTTAGIHLVTLSITGVFSVSGFYSQPFTVSGLSQVGIITPEFPAICKSQVLNVSVTGTAATNFKWSYSKENLTFVGISTASGASLSFIPQDSVYIKLVVKNGSCPNDSTVSTRYSVTPQPIISVFNYQNGALGATFCKTSTSLQPNLTTFGGGSFSSIGATFLDQTLGLVDLANSPIGRYSINYLVPAINRCMAVSTTTSLTITDLFTPTVSYAGNSFCNAIETPINPTSSTFTGGSFFSTPPGLSISGINGSIASTKSNLGTYRIFYAIPSVQGCAPATSLGTNLSIIGAPFIANFTYLNSPYCGDGQIISPDVVPSGGKFLPIQDVAINTITGSIETTLTRAGTYSIVYQIASSSNCTTQSKTSTVTIDRPNQIAIPSYQKNVFCSNENNPIPLNTINPKSWYEASVGIAINSITGQIDLAKSTIGNSQIFLNLPPNGACSATKGASNITISGAAIAPVLSLDSCKLISSGNKSDYRFWYRNNEPIHASRSDQYLTNLLTGTYKTAIIQNNCFSFSNEISSTYLPDLQTVTINGSQILTLNCPFVNTIVGINTDTLTKIFPQRYDTQIHIYPNPSKGNIYIAALSASQEIEICTIVGEVIKKISWIDDQTPLALNLPDGIYFLRIGQFSRKLVIQNF